MGELAGRAGPSRPPIAEAFDTASFAFEKRSCALRDDARHAGEAGLRSMIVPWGQEPTLPRPPQGEPDGTLSLAALLPRPAGIRKPRSGDRPPAAARVDTASPDPASATEPS